MAVNYTIFSDDTYRNKLLPYTLVQEWGLPLTQWDEVEEMEEPRTWTLEQVDQAGLNSAGKTFPVQEDENGCPSREFEGAPTDWVRPFGSTGRNVIAWIEALAAAKGVDPNHCFLSVKQTQVYLNNEGAMPEPI